MCEGKYGTIGQSATENWRAVARILRRGLVAIVGLGLVASSVSAQTTGRVVGRVTGPGGAAVSEVQVYLPASGLGSLTRANGSFILLEVPVGTHEIRAERIGLATATQQITVSADQVTEVNFQLQTQALGLDEIVVTGTAGAARRREIGNSIAQINPSDLPERPKKVEDILQASAPGINVGAVGGGIGQGQRITLRGNNSVSMSNQPIIYIDGVRIQANQFPKATAPDNRGNRGPNLTANPLSMVNPSDIDRIEVIKGSAATTLYGTEASAGVIQIFTKSGSSGEAVWTMEAQGGQSWSREHCSVCLPGPSTGAGGGHYRMDPYLSNGYIGQLAASVRGGGQNLQYFASGQYTNEDGLLPLDAGEKWNIRSNFTFTPSSDLVLQWNTSFSRYQIQTTPIGSSAEGVTLNAYRAERNYFGSGDPEVIGAVFEWDMQTTLERFTTGGTVTYSPSSSFTNRFTIGYDFSEQFVNSLRPVGHEFWPTGALNVHNWEDRLLTFDYVGTVRLNLTDAVTTNFSWGGQAVGDEIRQVEGWALDFPGALNPTLSSAAQTQAFQNRQRVWNAGFFLQNIFGIQDRYFFTAGVRVDGNSAFGEGFGLQAYPKASASWVMSEEDFWPESWGDLKVRAAFGKSGRAPGAFDAVRTWQGSGWNGDPAFVPLNVGNPDLGPEVSTEIEVGFDASWFDDRLGAVFTYYNQKTASALFTVDQIPTEGFLESQVLNVGELQNTGIELALNTTLIRSSDYGWDVNVNVTTNNSKVLDLGGAPAFSVGNSGWIIEGEPAPVMFARRITNPDEIADAIIEKDHAYGPNAPTLIIAPSTSLRLPGGILLSARGEYQGGHFMDVNHQNDGGVNRGAKMPLCWPYYEDPNAAVNATKLALDRTPAVWRQRCTAGKADDDWLILSADFFRLRSVSMTLPVTFAFPDNVDDAALTLSLNQSWTWFNEEWIYFDPEMQGNNGTADQVVAPGYRLPIPIEFRAALQVRF